MIRAQEEVVAMVALCQPGTHTGSTMLSPGRYDLWIEMLPFSTGVNKVSVDHPR